VYITRVPSFLLKSFMKIELDGEYIEFSIKFASVNRNLEEELMGLNITIDGTVIFDIDLIPNNFHIRLNDIFYNNQDLFKIYNKKISTLDKFVLIIPNSSNIIAGKHKISFYSKISNLTVTTRLIINEKPEYSPIQEKFQNELHHHRYCPLCKNMVTEENQKFCEFCGYELIKS